MAALAPAILAQDLSFRYPAYDSATAPQPVWQHLHLRVEAGTALTVAGGNGSGNSTLCYVLAGLAPRHTDGEAHGALHLADHDVLAAPPSPRLVGLLFQDAAVQLFNTTAEDEVAWGLEALGLAPEGIGPQVGVVIGYVAIAAGRLHQGRHLRRAAPKLLQRVDVRQSDEVRHVQIAPHLYCGPVVGAANVQLATCSPNFLILESIEEWGEFHAQILKKPMVFEDGHVIPPTSPGLGVELDEDVAAAHPYTGDMLHLEMTQHPVSL